MLHIFYHNRKKTNWKRKKDCAEGNLSYDRTAEADILMWIMVQNTILFWDKVQYATEKV